MRSIIQTMKRQKPKFGFGGARKGQANKSAGRMPWHWEPTKDVVSCEKLRGIASKY